jgi:arsenite-transporting ATPase
VRILLITGKGGVGKTTVAAATALAAAEAGHRTLVLSTDPAHSLADALTEPIGSRPTEVATRLHAQQLDARQRMEESWEEIRSYLVEVLDWAGVDGIEAEELAVLPGLDEVFALSDLHELAGDGRWDTLVVDCAPTAETIRLLSLPEVLSWYMDRAFPATRRLNKIVGPVVARVSSLPVASDAVFAAGHRFYERIDAVRGLLADTETTSARLVVNPERMVVAEARRTYTYLSLFGYGVDAVIANRLLPDGIVDPWFDRWKAVHAEQLDEIEASFAPVPVLRAELAEQELLGVDALTAFGRRLYGGDDPTERRHDSTPMRLERAGDEVRLILELPGAESGEVSAGRRGDELMVTVGPYRRAVMLPDSLRRRHVRSAGLEAGTLVVTFDQEQARS